eukprot:GEMP01026028.1.p1 GENE.GEMP01026028.1~~GEMP01026028.1.p1  ORF type:complete len:553 (+),score=134.25 GEMP01026028.1:93-1751(+)
MKQLVDEAIAELKEWETHRKLAFQNWEALTENVHDVIRSVTKRGLDLNQLMATFFEQKLEADRDYARRLMQPTPVPEEGGEPLGVLEFLYETQRRTAKHMDKWCTQLEKDLVVVTGEKGLLTQFKQTSEKKLGDLADLRTKARDFHKAVCDDWLAHQLRHATNQNPGPDHVRKDLFETERHFRQQATRCQNAQVEATVASEEALREIRKLELWRHEMLTKIATSFGQKLHKCWTEMQTITNEGIMWLSQHNYKNNLAGSPKTRQNEENSASIRTKEIDDLFQAGEGQKSKMQHLKDLANYERLPTNSRFERFSGKLLRPPRGINPLGQWKEVLVVITVDGLMHGVPPDPRNREMIFSINCNDASIRTQKAVNFEIEESESVSWGFFSKKNKVTLRAKTKEERDQWMRVLQHFQTNPVDFEQLLREHNSPTNSPRNRGSAGSMPPPPPPPPPPRQSNESVLTSTVTRSFKASSSIDDGISIDALSEQHVSRGSVDALSEQRVSRGSETQKGEASVVLDTAAEKGLLSPADVISEEGEAQNEDTSIRHSTSVFE